MPLQTEYNKDTIKESILNKLLRYYGCTIEDATPKQIYAAVASTVRDQIMLKWRFEKEARRAEKAKRLYYLSIEFLTGRWLHNNLLNLCSTKEYEKAFEELGLTLRGVLHEEPEPALGNGGLGRLAACFLDSLATLNLPAMGCTIRYEYGLFRQRIVDGQQVEVPDEWLTYGNAWEIPTQRDAVEVCFGGQMVENWVGGTNYVTLKNTENVIAVPYDLPIVGYDSDVVDRLRTWSAVLPQNFNLEKFSAGDYNGSTEDSNSIAAQISKVLYPEDNTYNGKKLRLMQEYFLVSATLQYAIKDFKRVYGTDMSQLPEKVAFHINDTHPAMVIPELMRILLDECGYTWEKAFDITRRTFAYTNHTVMSEALEKWNEDIFKKTLPRIYQICVELDHRCRADLERTFPGDEGKINYMAVLGDGQVRMANICCYVCHSINGVSQLHSEIIKQSVFHDYFLYSPEKFTNVTNGIAYRRWLLAANPGLTGLLEDTIGPGFKKDASELKKLEKFKADKKVLSALEDVKDANKVIFAQHLKKVTGQEIDPHTLFDVQVKRMHEYKRQHLNALNIAAQYLYIKNNPNADVVPKTYIFGAKAAPGYYMAKQMIRLICKLGALIDADPMVREKLRVVYLEDYNVTTSERLMPASEVSEQISLAGTEASGTGNMKFMLNGAVTLGTLDGANVEIAEAAGRENEIIFGMLTPEVNDLKRFGYHPSGFINNCPEAAEVLAFLERGWGGESLHEIVNNLRTSDPYMVMADFADYRRAQNDLSGLYRDRGVWNRMSLMNIANAGIFSADRAVNDYARDIWGATPVK